MDDAIAVVEAKSCVNSIVFEQLRNTGSEVEKLFGKEKGVILVVGAPNFPPPLREIAFKCGYTIIQLSGAGYEVPKQAAKTRLSLNLNKSYHSFLTPNFLTIS